MIFELHTYTTALEVGQIHSIAPRLLKEILSCSCKLTTALPLMTKVGTTLEQEGMQFCQILAGDANAHSPEVAQLSL